MKKNMDLDTAREVMNVYTSHKSWLYYKDEYNINEETMDSFKKLFNIIKGIKKQVTDLETLEEMARLCELLNIQYSNYLNDANYPHICITIEDSHGVYGEHSTTIVYHLKE